LLLWRLPAPAGRVLSDSIFQIATGPRFTTLHGLAERERRHHREGAGKLE
jgi:hypothetical protein